MADQMRGNHRAVPHGTHVVVHLVLNQMLEIVQFNVLTAFALLVELESFFDDFVGSNIAVEENGGRGLDVAVFDDSEVQRI